MKRGPALWLAVSASACALAQPPKGSEEVVALDQVSVVGRGETRATSAVPRAEVSLVPGGAELVLILKKLPGLIVHTNDTLGLYEWGLTVRMRGFDLTQIAFDIDGVPMGRNDVRGNRVSRFIDNENLQGVTVSQGSGDVSTPAYSALGGAVHYTTTAPETRAGAKIVQSFGSESLARTYMRADTGSLAGGWAAYASGSHTRTNHAFGPGHIERDHAEVKLQKRLGTADVMLAYRFNDRFDHDVYSLALEEFYELGRDHEVLADSIVGDPDDDALYYKLWTNARRDHLLHGRIDVSLATDARLRFVPYFQNQSGNGTAGEAHGGTTPPDPIVPTGPRRLVGFATSHKGNRAGLTGRGEWRAGRHALAAGFWLETERYSQRRGSYDVTPDLSVDYRRPLFAVYDRLFRNEVTQAYVEYRIALLDERLTLSLGAKGLCVDRTFRGIPNTQASFTAQRVARGSVFKDWFQPQVGSAYRVTAETEAFANYAQNFSVPILDYHANLNYDPGLRPERSENLDAGVRFSRGRIDASLTGYLIRYRHRILAILDPADRFSVPEPLLQNVGSVHTGGVEAALAWRPATGWRVGSALAYTDSRFRDDYFDGPDLVPVRDRVTPDTPRWQAQASVDYAGRTGFFAGGELQYLSERFGTPINNQALPGYMVCAGRVGYLHARTAGWIREVRVQLAVDNVFDKTYLGQIDAPGVFESFYYPGAPRTWLATVALGF